MTVSEQEFLREYSIICEKYQMYISSCGCCFSPWVTDKVKDESVEEHIKHLVEQCK